MVLAFDLFYLLACALMATNIGGISRRIYDALRKTWDQMATGSFNQIARLSMIIGQLPFWAFRIFFLLALTVGGIAMLLGASG
jgi:hypothetical protein